MQIVTAEQVTDAVLSGAWVIDLRARSAHAEGHLPGTVSIEYPTESDRFATYVGWLLPWHDDIVLLTDAPGVLEPALRELARIGIDDVGTHVLEAGASLTASYRRADWDDYRAACATRDPVVVDVRSHDEWHDGHLPGAFHLALQDVELGAAALPSGELWVHCRSGYHAGIAASLLHRAGRDVVHVDDSWERCQGLPLVEGPAAA